MKCSELQKERAVVFKVDPYHEGYKETYYGEVVSIDRNQKTVCVSYLARNKGRSDIISFDDMIAAYDRKGEMMNFNGIKGKSVLLIAE